MKFMANKNGGNLEKTLYFIEKNKSATSVDIQKYLNLNLSYASDVLRKLRFIGYLERKVEKNPLRNGGTMYRYFIINLEKDINQVEATSCDFSGIKNEFDIDISKIPDYILKRYKPSAIESPLHKIMKIWAASEFYNKGYKIKFEHKADWLGKIDVLAVKEYDIQVIECETINAYDYHDIISKIFHKSKHNSATLVVPKIIWINKKLDVEKNKQKLGRLKQFLEDYNIGFMICPYYEQQPPNKNCRN